MGARMGPKQPLTTLDQRSSIIKTISGIFLSDNLLSFSILENEDT